MEWTERVRLRPTEHQGEKVRILQCGSNVAGHVGKVGTVIEAGPEDGPRYLLVRLPVGGDCLAVSVDDPSDEGRD